MEKEYSSVMHNRLRVASAGRLVKVRAELDEAMKYHLQNAAAFKGTSNTIQNELLQCMLEVCHDEITIEIKKIQIIQRKLDEKIRRSNQSNSN
ncbi:hypothetical protein NQ318_008199 [Aromia moschata]|uniref:Uncharacterized protein n=1 Tax=Aromia moschata TaxID=1265417 RepID=A0AAV8YHM8_9CUCU|nr:hypothetical protein NQ318_008199 [Aromia moschata]